MNEMDEQKNGNNANEIQQSQNQQQVVVNQVDHFYPYEGGIRELADELNEVAIFGSPNFF